MDWKVLLPDNTVAATHWWTILAIASCCMYYIVQQYHQAIFYLFLLMYHGIQSTIYKTKQVGTSSLGLGFKSLSLWIMFTRLWSAHHLPGSWGTQQYTQWRRLRVPIRSYRYDHKGIEGIALSTWTFTWDINQEIEYGIFSSTYWFQFNFPHFKEFWVSTNLLTVGVISDRVSADDW